MGVSIPNASTLNWFQFADKTQSLGPRGTSADYKQFVVSQPGEFNFKINDSYTSFRIMNSRNEVVAQASSTYEAAQASAKLAPGTYTALIEQQRKGVNGRDYSLDISHRANAMVLAPGGTLKGTVYPSTGKDPGVQKHSLNVVQGGDFTFDFSLRNARWAIMGKDGKVVASGDTLQSNANTDNNPLTKPHYKLDPGQYEVVIVPPRAKANEPAQEMPFRLTALARTANVDMPTEERPIDKIMRERDARLRKWAAETPVKAALKTSASA